MRDCRIRYTLEELFCLLLRFSLIPWLLRNIYASDKITIINYHDPAAEVFKKHLSFFSQHYTIISIDQVAEALLSGWEQLPPRPLVITFDDGYAGNANLIEIIAKQNIPALIYVTAGLANTSRKFWFDVIPRTSETITEMEYLDDQLRRDLLEKIYNHKDDREYEVRDTLNAEEIKGFIAAGCTVGSHTLFHPFLTKCDKETATYELKESKRILEQLAGGTIRHFAYPGGKWNDRVKKWCQDAGYVTARTIDPGWVSPGADLLALPNFGISDNAGLSKAMVQSSGLWDVIKQFVTSLRKHSCKVFRPRLTKCTGGEI